jgi:hypothetical protein
VGGEPFLPQAFNGGQPFFRRPREPVFRIAWLRLQRVAGDDFFHGGLIVAVSYMAM